MKPYGISWPETISEKTFREITHLRRDQSVDVAACEKVIFHKIGIATKIWSKKRRLLTSANIYPYDMRFVRNASLLKAKGVSTPRIIRHAKLNKSSIRLVQYEMLPGQAVRDVLSKNPNGVDWSQLANFFHKLHRKGIFFRSIHFGNIIQVDKTQFGLIDFTDVAFYRKGLGFKRRIRNLGFPLRYEKDVTNMNKSSGPTIVAHYLEQSQWELEIQKRFNDGISLLIH
jgi:hypothetical protein